MSDRPDKPVRLTGKERAAFEQSQLARVKRTDRDILRAIFGDGGAGCFGSAVTWIGNAKIAEAAGVGERTVPRSLMRLEAAGIILTVDDSSKGSRRQIVVRDHPGAAAVIAELEASPHVRWDRCREGRPVSDKSRGRLSNWQPRGCQTGNPEVVKLATKPFSVESSKSQSEEDGGRDLALMENGERPEGPGGPGSRPEDPARVAPAPKASQDGPVRQAVASAEASLDQKTTLTAIVASGVCKAASRPPAFGGRRLRSLVNLDDAPPDDPVIAAERARRAHRLELTDAAILGAVLGEPSAPSDPEPADRAPDSDSAPADPPAAPDPTAEPMRGGQLRYEQESAVVEMMRGLTEGSTDREIHDVAFNVSMILRDAGSRACWKKVAFGVARGEIPVSVFMQIAGANVLNPSRVILARIKRQAPGFFLGANEDLADRLAARLPKRPEGPKPAGECLLRIAALSQEQSA